MEPIHPSAQDLVLSVADLTITSASSSMHRPATSSFISSRPYLQRRSRSVTSHVVNEEGDEGKSPLSGGRIQYQAFYRILQEAASELDPEGDAFSLVGGGPEGFAPEGGSRVPGNQAGKYAELLEQLGMELLEAMPDDPIEFLLSTLTFPFAVGGSASLGGPWHGAGNGLGSNNSSPNVSEPPSTFRSILRTRSMQLQQTSSTTANAVPPTGAEEREAPPPPPTMPLLSLSATAPPKFKRRSSRVFEPAPTTAHRCPVCANSPISKGFSLPDFSMFSQKDLGPKAAGPCCTYEIRRPFFRREEDSTDALQNFLSSNETIIVIVGDDDAAASQPGLCASPRSTPPGLRRSSCSTSASSSIARASSVGSCVCSGAGKSKLCQWLDFPGRFIHGRKIIHVDSGTVGSFFKFLEHETLSTNPLPAATAAMSIPSLFPTTLSSPNETEGSEQHSSAVAMPFSTPAAGMMGVGGGNNGASSPWSPNRWRAAEVRNLNSLDPSLTLIDSIEPPHFILDALHRHRYFRTEPAVRCPKCRSVSHNVALHKTIVFTRRSIFFKFPFPCRILSIARRPHNGGGGYWDVDIDESSTSRRSFNANISGSVPTLHFTNEHAIVGDTGERTQRISIILERTPPTLLSNHSIKYRKSLTNESLAENFGAGGNSFVQLHDALLGEISYDTALAQIIAELEDSYAHRTDPLHRATLSLASSDTFKQLKYSRGRVEWDLAGFLVERELYPRVDLSEFPVLTRYIVGSPGSDLYILRLLNTISRCIRTSGTVHPLESGNLLCLAVASHHSLSPFHTAITAHDALQLYLLSLLPSSRMTGSLIREPSLMLTISSDEGLQQLAQQQQQQHHHPTVPTALFGGGIACVDEGVMTSLDLQNLILGRLELPPQPDGVLSPMVAHSLLDVRGADMPGSLEDLLIQGVSIQRYQHQVRTAPISAAASFAFDGFSSSPNNSVASISGFGTSQHHVGSPMLTHHHHPVRLSSEFTVVGEQPYAGKADEGSPPPAATASLHNTSSHVNYCFLVHLDDEGCSAVVLVESTRVYACKSFSGTHTRDEFIGGGSFIGGPREDLVPDWTQRPFWSVEVSDRTIHFACLLSDTYPHHEQPPTECSCLEEVLVMQLSDSSVIMMAINRVPRDAVVKIGKASDGGGSSGFWGGLPSSRQMTMELDTSNTDETVGGSPFGIPVVSASATPLTPSKGGRHAVVKFAVDTSRIGNTSGTSLHGGLGQHGVRQHAESAPASPTTSVFDVKTFVPSSFEGPASRGRSQSSSVAGTASEEPLSPFVSRFDDVEITVDFSLCPLRYGEGKSLGREAVLLSSISSSSMARSMTSAMGATQNLVRPVPAEQFLSVYPTSLFNVEGDAEGPHLCAVSCRWMAVAADEDSDIITVVRHGFNSNRAANMAHLNINTAANTTATGANSTASNGGGGGGMQRKWVNRRKSSSAWSASTTGNPIGEAVDSKILMADEDRITSMCICRDEFLIIGCENGMVQVFNIEHAVSIKVFHFHEKAVRVVRPLVRFGQMAQHADPVSTFPMISPVIGRSAVSLLTVCFITGSDDTTMSFFAIDDRQQLKSARCHNAPLVDICTNSYLSRGIIVSADVSGAVVVSLVSPDNILGDMVTLWRNTTVGVRGIRLSPGSSWMTCTRDRQLPVAMPIAEWVRHGVGQFHIKPISVIHMSACERYLFTGGADGVIFVWDLQNQARFIIAFRKHALNSTIASISTCADGERVVSSDSIKFVQLWQRNTGEVLATLNHQAGQCIARFLRNDFILVKRQEDLKVYDSNGKLVLRTGAVLGESGTHSIDVFVASEEDCAAVFAADEIADAGRRPTLEAAAVPGGAATGSGSSVGDTTPLSLSDTHSPSDLEFDGDVPNSASNDSSESDEGRDKQLRQRMQASTRPRRATMALQRPPQQRGGGSLPRRGMVTEDVSEIGVSDPLLRDRCFLGICNNTSGHVVDIYSFRDLTRPRYVLRSGEIENLEDSSDDEELVFHEDNVQFFSFLPGRMPVEGGDGVGEMAALPQWGSRRQSTVGPTDGGASGSTQALEATLTGAASLSLDSPRSPGAPCRDVAATVGPPRPPHQPSLFLALTGSDDLTVILWNWWRQEPLLRIPHTSFPTCGLFWYPTASASFHSATRQYYSDEQLEFLWDNDALLHYEMEGGPLCTFVTAQECVDGVSLRVFEVREKRSNYNQRCLMQRMGAQQSVRAFNTIPLLISQVGTASRGQNRSVSTLCVRPSDGLICTDTTSIPEVVFWRWMPNGPHECTPGGFAAVSPDEGDFEDGGRPAVNRKPPPLSLRPQRRISSRL